jgi:serine/threonine protein kinase
MGYYFPDISKDFGTGTISRKHFEKLEAFVLTNLSRTGVINQPTLHETLWKRNKNCKDIKIKSQISKKMIEIQNLIINLFTVVKNPTDVKYLYLCVNKALGKDNALDKLFEVVEIPDKSQFINSIRNLDLALFMNQNSIEPIKSEFLEENGLVYLKNCNVLQKSKCKYRKSHPLGAGTFTKVHSFEGPKPLCRKKLIYFQNKTAVNEASIREIYTLAKARNCPQIVQMYDVEITPQKCYIWLESLPSTILFYRKFITKMDVPNILLQVAKGLEFLHKCGIIHRDLKPDNILIQNSRISCGNGPTVKIIDFNSSKVCSNEDHTTEVVTLSYRAPEVLAGWKNYDYAVDIWSFGVILVNLHRKYFDLFSSNEFPCDEEQSGTNSSESIGQLSLIFEKMGSPETHGGITKSFYDTLFQDSLYFEKIPKQNFDNYFNKWKPRKVIKKLGEKCLDLCPLFRPDSKTIVDTLKRN